MATEHVAFASQKNTKRTGLSKNFLAIPPYMKKQIPNQFSVVIPAIKKNVAFPDDLIKKMCGVTLIQRAIHTAKGLAPLNDIHVATDSEEISLICERENVRHHYDPDLTLEGDSMLHSLKRFLLGLKRDYRDIILFSPYLPLMTSAELRSMYEEFLHSTSDCLVAVREVDAPIFSERAGAAELLTRHRLQPVQLLVDKLAVFHSSIVSGQDARVDVGTYPISDAIIEIRNYRDWWVCEKLMKRKRLVFRVIGYSEVGMGHIYRALALAHEISDHEILFVCDERSSLAVDRIAGSDYPVQAFPPDKTLEGILDLRPDMVVNDILDTDADYMRTLADHGILTVNFEDLGDGAPLADMTLNDLYETPKMDGRHIRWGNRWFFLRDEFDGAAVHVFPETVQSVLVTFGGTDQHDLTRQTLQAIAPYCRENGIRINVVTGPGYAHKEETARMLDRPEMDHVTFTFATGVMSRIMEDSDVAVCSNGRTTYELCHMNLPAVVVSQHARENTHTFACPDNGFINLGVVDEDTPAKTLTAVQTLVENRQERKRLHERMTEHDFSGNKAKVVSLMHELLEA